MKVTIRADHLVTKQAIELEAMLFLVVGALLGRLLFHSPIVGFVLSLAVFLGLLVSLARHHRIEGSLQ